jgi:transposase InsO family protein
VLKDDGPVYRKQYQIPEAHNTFIEETLTEWLKLGVVRRSQSMYNSPIFCVPKKTGQGLRIVQDFRELNEHSHIDKYSMKEINECIGDIGRANSTIFTTLDLTSGFWQMPLHPDDAHKTAFTIPGKGQFEWITSPMGLLGCPASFQRMMEKFMRGIPNVIVYIDDLLIHSKNHEEHLVYLEKVLQRLEENHMKLNIEKCFFGNTEVSYLGFVLTPEGIKPGRDKLKAIKAAQPPTDMKAVRSFIGLCNFFRTHIKNFATVSAPLTKLTRKDSGYNGGPLPKEALDAFLELKKRLMTDPVVAYPRSDRKYVLITDASTGTDKIAGGFGAILAQVDEKGNYHAIAYGSRQLRDHETNYSPYLAEMAAANWGMEYFDNYLRGKPFTLYTDHKPLEKLSHLHTKTMNRLQENMLTYDFQIQYKKGATLPADFLSRDIVEGLNEVVNSVDPFGPDLQQLQLADEQLIKINSFQKEGKWPLNTPKSEQKLLLPLTNSLFLDSKAVWIRLNDENYPRTALWLPKIYRKKAICECHGTILSGHDALKKTYLRITNAYFWPNMKKDIQAHIDSCLQCQVRKKSTAKPTPLQTLPTVDQPNQRVHIDLFGPLKTSGQGNKMVLVMTDAFTKYAEAIAIPDKQAETVAMEIFVHWICRFGSPVQIHSDNGTEFVNKLNKELFKLLEIKHTTTTPAHPQCNAQAEVFNKTMAKYLASFVDESTLDWEQYLPALQFSYNTSYHSTIATTPFELLYGMKPRTPSIPGQDVQRKFYGESFASERLQILQKARQIAKEHIEEKQEIYKKQHDKKAKDHDFSIGQQVWYLQTEFIGKNKKLAPKYIGPATIIEINKSVAKLKTDKNKVKTLNVNKLKHFFPAEDIENNENIETDAGTQENNKLIKFDVSTKRPLTRAWSKLIKNSDAISALINKSDAASSEEIWYKLNNIAFKLYHLNLDFNQLTSEELKFWKTFKQEDIFEWLSGSPIHPPDYTEYIRIRSSFEEPQLQPQQQPAQPQPGPAVQNQVPQPSPRKPGRPPGSKNKPKDPITRAAHYASKRFTRAATKLLPDAARKNASF